MKKQGEKELTGLEKHLLDQLNKHGQINWTSTRSQHTAGLNRLVKKGYAVYHHGTRVWTPKPVSTEDGGVKQ